jgi:hypothetical protein
MTYHDRPVGLLIPWREESRIVSLLEWPPPPDYRVPRRVHMRVTPDVNGPTMQRTDRVFRREPSLQAAEHRWWLIYNDGRSRTPEYVPVYLEQP